MPAEVIVRPSATPATQRCRQCDLLPLLGKCSVHSFTWRCDGVSVLRRSTTCRSAWPRYVSLEPGHASGVPMRCSAHPCRASHPCMAGGGSPSPHAVALACRSTRRRLSWRGAWKQRQSECYDAGLGAAMGTAFSDCMA